MESNLTIQRLRESRGMTQQQVADNLHVTRSAVCLWEKGVRRPSRDNLIAMSSLFGCSVDVLLGREGPPESAAS